MEYWEPISRKLFRKLAKNSNVIIDIGAYTGSYSLESSISNTNSEVIAVEPNPLAAETLRKNILENKLGNINVWEFALGSKESEMPLYSTSDVSGNSMTSLIRDDKLIEQSLVSVQTIDSLFNNKIVDLIKMDVEGFEDQVLLGARSILERDRPLLLMEALTDVNLASQSAILILENYNLPIKIGHARGDDRNYVWIPKEKRNLFLKIKIEVSLMKIIFFFRRYE